MEENKPTRGRPPKAALPLPNDTIEIDAKELRELRISNAMYRAMLDAGVTRWDGYHLALTIFHQEYKGHLI